MGIFDKLKQSAMDTVMASAASMGNKSESFTFSALPESLAELQALPEAALDTPFQTAALTVLALCAYAADRQIGTDMLNWLRGPRPLNGQEISFASVTERPTFPSPTLPILPPTTITHLLSPIPSGWKATMFPVRSRAI